MPEPLGCRRSGGRAERVAAHGALLRVGHVIETSSSSAKADLLLHRDLWPRRAGQTGELDAAIATSGAASKCWPRAAYQAEQLQHHFGLASGEAHHACVRFRPLSCALAALPITVLKAGRRGASYGP